MSDKNFFVFIGRSGCGKGTQAELLKDYLEKKNPSRSVVWFGIGKHFREFVKDEGYTQGIVREYLKSGDLMPEFLAIHIWSHFFIENLKGNEDVILDGTPRKREEANVLDGAFEIYGVKVYIIFVNVSREWATERLLGRGRSDDAKEEIEKRLNWYESDVAPTVEFYKNHPTHSFFDINGEQTIEEVYREIVKKLNF